MARDFAHEAQQAAEKRLEACDAVMDLEGEDYNDPAIRAQYEKAYEGLAGPYDGCTTCIVREVLDAVWPILQEAAKDELENPSSE